MADTPNDRWRKFDITAKAVSALLLPLIIGLVGHWYTSQQEKASNDRLQQQQKADTEQHKVDRVAGVLKHLASDSARERLLGTAFVNFLNEHDQAPSEFGPVLTVILKKENDPDVYEAMSGSRVIPQSVESDPKLAQNIAQAAQSNPEKANALAKNPFLGETLTKIENSGVKSDREIATAAIKSVFKSTIFEAHDNEDIKVEITAVGTAPLVTYTLDGESHVGTSFSFRVDKSKHNPSRLQVVFEFSNASGDDVRYEVKITGNKTATPLIYFAKQYGSSTIVDFRFYIA